MQSEVIQQVTKKLKIVRIEEFQKIFEDRAENWIRALVTDKEGAEFCIEYPVGTSLEEIDKLMERSYKGLKDKGLGREKEVKV